MKGADMMIAVVESFATAATIKYIASIVTWPGTTLAFQDVAERAWRQRKKTGGTSTLISFLMILMAFSVQVIHVKALPKVLSTNRLRGTLSTALVARFGVTGSARLGHAFQIDHPTYSKWDSKARFQITNHEI
jgi:hypothetical protein